MYHTSAWDTILGFFSNNDGQIVMRKLFETGIVIFLGCFILFSIVNLINKNIKNIKKRHVLRKYIVYSINIILFISVFFIWVQGFKSLSIFLGFAGAGVALALQEVILCIAGWILILIKKPFDVGDRIELNGIKGDVIDVRLFQLSLFEVGNWVKADQSTGRIVNIPNSFVFKHANYNYNRGFEFIWNEIPITITFESDWRKAKAIMLKHARDLAHDHEAQFRQKIENMRKKYMVYYGKVTPIVYVDIHDSGINLTLRYLTETKTRRCTQDSLCSDILDDFAKESEVNLAYPTYRIVKTS